ncbi:MAG: hypothetical protein WD844_04210 [Thermoleophilaceae bacterium]
MKERKGPVGRVGGLAAGLAAAARRRQSARDPRVVVYDSAGHARVLAPTDPLQEGLLAAGRELIDLGVVERG